MMNHGISLSATTASDDDGEVVIASLDLDAHLGKYGDERFLEHRTKNARCNPNDDPDHVIGELLATGRALESLGKRLQREAWGRIKHKDDMEVQKRVDEIIEWADMQVQHNLYERIQRAVIGVHGVGETKLWGLNTYIEDYSGWKDPIEAWRWFTEQDPAEMSRGIYRDGVIHGISKHRVKEVQKGVRRVLDEHEALVRKTKDDLRGEQA